MKIKNRLKHFIFICSIKTPITTLILIFCIFTLLYFLSVNLQVGTYTKLDGELSADDDKSKLCIHAAIDKKYKSQLNNEYTSIWYTENGDDRYTCKLLDIKDRENDIMLVMKADVDDIKNKEDIRSILSGEASKLVIKVEICYKKESIWGHLFSFKKL